MNPEYIGLQSILKTHLELAGALSPVRFQLHAPQARSVALIGEMTDWKQAPHPMQRDGGGTWHTTLRLRQGQWLYKFMVDGEFIEDPANPLKADDGWGGYHSYLLLGDGDWSSHLEVAYGEMLRIEFDSAILGKARLHLYLPPGYDRRKEYPLLTLLHGYRTKVNQWASNGMVRNFMGNLLAQGQIDPFIVAMPAPCGGENAERFGDYLCNELPDWLGRHFAVAQGRDGMAVAGMSQYGHSAFSLALRPERRFGFAAPVGAFFPGQFLMELGRNPPQVDFGLKLYCGSEDYVAGRNDMLVGILRKSGLRPDYLRVNGDHSWRTWNSLTRDLLVSVSEFFSAGRA